MEAAESSISETEGTAPLDRPHGLGAIRLHVALVVVVVVCSLAFSVELQRALGGNALSWAYVFEWPIFALFGVVMWLRTMRPGWARSVRVPSVKPEVAPEFEGMLARWQDEQRKIQQAGGGVEPSHEDAQPT